MQMHRIGAMAHKACRACAVVLGLHMACGALPALAQTPATGAEAAPSEAVRRQALGPYRFILQNASAPAKPSKPVATAPTEARRPAAPAPVEQAAIAPIQPAPVLEPLVAAPLPAPAPVAPVAAMTPRAAEPAPIVAVRKELVAIKQDPPELTAALLREQATGTVKVAFDVNPDGTTAGVKVVASSNRKLNNVSITAVSGWKFQPIGEVRPTEIELVFSN